MKHMTLTALAALTLGLPGLAFAAADADANGDGLLSLEEVLVAHPDLTEANFVAMDVNADGVLDADEAAAAQEAGLLPASDG